MNKLTVAGLSLCLLAGAIRAQDKGKGIETDLQKTSYVIGMNIGGGIRRDGLEVDADALAEGLLDALAGKQPQVSGEDAQRLMMALQKKMQEKSKRQNEEQAAAAPMNEMKGKAYRDEYGKKDGVVKTDSGLLYRVIKEGKGDKPAAGDTVTVDYKGTLIDGNVFDSSYDRGEAATFPVNGVIKGWQEILQLMPVGSKYEVVIPPELAYGPRGSGAKIGPQSTLIFEVELKSIKE